MRPQAAVAQLAALLERQPNDVVALNNIAWLLAERDSGAAEKYARRAYSIAPQSAAVGDTLGWVLLKKGIRRCWMQGPMPLAGSGRRLIGPEP